MESGDRMANSDGFVLDKWIDSICIASVFAFGSFALLWTGSQIQKDQLNNGTISTSKNYIGTMAATVKSCGYLTFRHIEGID